MHRERSSSRPGHVLVLGGGPAGSLAAVLLARGGIHVTLIEQNRFPRDKVCGECLSALGREVLERHGLEDPLKRLGRELLKAHLFAKSRQAEFNLPSPMLGVSRAAMDQSLLSAAVAAGVVVRQPARAEAIDPVETGVQTRWRDLVTNLVEVAEADCVLIADGRGAWLRPRPAPSNKLGLKAHFRNVGANADAITLYGGIGCYGGVAPIEADTWNAAFSIPRSMAADAKGDLNAIWEMIVGRSPVIASHFRSAKRVSDWLASPLPRHRVVREWHPRVIPIGAAACAIEPVGGEGMGTALRSAELAANALLAGTLDQLPAAYERLWNRRSLFCQIGGRALADEGWSDSVGLASHTVLARVAMKLVGK